MKRLAILPALLLALSACGDDDSNNNNGQGGATNTGGTANGNGGSSNTAGSGGKSNTAGSGGKSNTAGSSNTGGDEGGSGPTTGDAWHNKPNRGEVVDPGHYVSTEDGSGRFALVSAPIVVAADDYPGVVRVAGDLQTDIESVTDVKPDLAMDDVPSGEKQIILVGTLGHSPLIDELVSSNKLDVDGIAGRWETFATQIVDNPMDGVDRALVIAGSDQRGTIYGVYDLSKQIGVSPWYYWDDVPAQKHSQLYVLPGRHSQGEPAVKYRGFFINDENPDLGTWGPKTFGPAPNKDFPSGFNHELYAKIFETMLRLKANYLWPAVWGRAFAEDDEENHATAKLYGIVMGTSHEAPMMRGIEEWNRHAVAEVTDDAGNVTTEGSDPYGGNGLWRYSKNPDALEKYWTDGIKRMVDEDFEGVVTLGMRGPGDVSLPVEDGKELMTRVIEKQRDIIADVTKKPVTDTPQVWTLYKEVEDYWDDGMRAPDDVTIVWCDDNWGNMRELPDQTDEQRAGGYGIYYHFDYVGGGRNYKWVDTNLLPNIWEQLHLSYNFGVDRLWMVNVGDMKNEELPLEYFLDYAWSPERWPLERITEWEQQWAEQQFGSDQASAIAEVLHTYGQLQSRRKPELTNRDIVLDPDFDITKTDQQGSAIVYNDWTPFNLTNYREMETATAEWDTLAEQATDIKAKLPAELQDAYYELVYYPVQATAYLYDHRLAAFKNILYAQQKRAATNDMGATATDFFNKGTDMATYYNTTLAGGKWDQWQLQPYVGYGDVERYGSNASWQQPEQNNVALPDAIYPHLQSYDAPDEQDIGVTIDGSDKVWPDETSDAVLPTFSPYQTQAPQYIEIFNRGAQDSTFSIEVPDDAATYLTVTPSQGTLDDTTKEVRAELAVDWTMAPADRTEVPITITGPNNLSVTVTAVIENNELPDDFSGFVEANGYVSMEADHFSRAVNTDDIWWQRIPDIGRTGSGMTPFPVTAPSQTPGGDTPHLEYDVHTFSDGDVTLWAYLSPRNNVLHNDGLKYAVSIDDDDPQIVNITTALMGIPMNRSWERNTSDNVNLTSTTHHITAGDHVVKLWMVDPTVIVQKLVIDTGGTLRSYLGPPESLRVSP